VGRVSLSGSSREPCRHCGRPESRPFQGSFL